MIHFYLKLPYVFISYLLTLPVQKPPNIKVHDDKDLKQCQPYSNGLVSIWWIIDLRAESPIFNN